MGFDVIDIQPRKDGSISGRIKRWWKSILLQKLSNPQVYVFLLLASIFFAFTISKGGLPIGILLIIAMTGPPVVWAVVAFPKFGILTLFVAAYLLFIPMKLDTGGFPLGTMMDVLEYLLILGFFIKQKNDRNWNVFKNPLSYIILAWIGYNFMELANPASVSALAWIYTIRTTAVVILMYFVFVYQIRDTAFIRLLFKIWIALALLAAIDAFIQEFIGFFPYERTWLYSDPLRVELLFQEGHM